MVDDNGNDGEPASTSVEVVLAGTEADSSTERTDPSDAYHNEGLDDLVAAMLDDDDLDSRGQEDHSIQQHQAQAGNQPPSLLAKQYISMVKEQNSNGGAPSHQRRGKQNSSLCLFCVLCLSQFLPSCFVPRGAHVLTQ